jgi:hypothetical protein
MSALPSQKRLTYCLLFDELAPKFLSKTSIKGLMIQRPDYTVIPIHFDDVKYYVREIKCKGARVIIQKLVLFMASVNA